MTYAPVCIQQLYNVDKAAINTLRKTNYEYSVSEHNPELGQNFALDYDYIDRQYTYT